MRGQTAMGIAIGGVVATGAGLITHGVITGMVTPYRLGLAVLLVGLASLVMHRSNCNTNRVMRHQARLAAETQKQRQEWAEYGYRAGELDAASGYAVRGRDAAVVDLADRLERRNGA